MSKAELDAVEHAREAVTCGEYGDALRVLRSLPPPVRPELLALGRAFEAGDGRAAKLALEVVDGCEARGEYDAGRLVWASFTAPMAEALRSDCKTETRRLSVRWGVGDVLGVLEPLRRDALGFAVYAADGAVVGCAWRWQVRGLPGRFMPRGVCRTWLRVLEVRREPLRNITDDGIAREGVTREALVRMLGARRVARFGACSTRELFALGWDRINGHVPGARWADNPVIAVTRFQRVSL